MLDTTLGQVFILGRPAIILWVFTKELRPQRMVCWVGCWNGLVVSEYVETCVDIFQDNLGERLLYCFGCAERDGLIVLVEHRNKILISDHLKNGCTSSRHSITITPPVMMLIPVDVCGFCLDPPFLKLLIFHISLKLLFHGRPLGPGLSQKFGCLDIRRFHQMLHSTTHLSIALQ